MNNKQKKNKFYIFLSIIIIGLVFLFIILNIPKFNNDIYITVVNNITNINKEYKIKKNQNIVNLIKPNNIDGYEYIGLYYNNKKIENVLNVNSNCVINIEYSKIYEIDNNLDTLLNDINNKNFITIKTINNYKISNENLIKILNNNNLKYINLKNCECDFNNLSENIFKNCKNLEYINLPKNIEILDEYCFNNFKNLKEIVLNNNLLKISENCFINCDKLKTINYVDSLEYIGNNAFKNCLNLKEFKITKNVNYIGELAFYNSGINNLIVDNTNFIYENNILYSNDYSNLILSLNYNKQKLQINNKTKIISDYAFYNNSKIKEIILSDKLESVGKSCFENCVNLENIIFNSSTDINITNLNKIGNESFKNCYNLSVFNFPDSVNEIGNCLFENCYNLSSVNLSSNILIIKEKMFYNNYNLISINSINSLIKTIENKAFENCYNLININCLNNIENIGISSFKNCKKLTNINFNNLQEISENCFENCELLTNISLKNIKSLKENCFKNCISLNKFLIEDNIEFIDKNCFIDCLNLKEFEIEDNLHFSVKNGVLYDIQKNKLICYPYSKNNTDFTILASINEFYDQSLFINEYLTNIYVEGENTIYKSIDGVLYSIDEKTLIRYPNNRFATTYTVLNNVEIISENAFINNNNIDTLIINNNVLNIESGALKGIKNLKNLTIPFIGKNIENNKYIGYIFGASSFLENNEYVCNKLENLIITEDNLIEEKAFYCVSSIKKIIFNKATIINQYAFYEMNNLIELKFESNLLKISSYSLYNLNKFETLTFVYSNDLVVESNSFGDFGVLRLTIKIIDNSVSFRSNLATIRNKFKNVYNDAEKWIYNNLSA